MELFIARIFSALFVLNQAPLHNLYIPDFMDKYAEAMIRKAKSEELQKVTTEAQGYKDIYKNPLMFPLMAYMEILPVCLIVSLITALMLKRKQKSVNA